MRWHSVRHAVVAVAASLSAGTALCACGELEPRRVEAVHFQHRGLPFLCRAPGLGLVRTVPPRRRAARPRRPT